MSTVTSRPDPVEESFPDGTYDPSDEVPLPKEPPDYEYAGIFDGDLRFLSCTHCGALIASDAVNITRHSETHRLGQPQPRSAIVEDDRLAGDDLAQLLRDSVKSVMHDQGLTQVKLAKMAGVSQKHLSQMFTGNAVGSLEVWSKIAAAVDRRWAVSLVDDDG